ncbi:MAG: arginyltransferase [Candidatus Azotimanducaceae bacterium]|uniref:Aspartate/glutamate leucyltransferase n=1 Tax=OM182 bacterium TaxID=2510334 RepID=A0A520RYZ1_9GAMM|nr:arginyltransferase [Gammaproteobacteria bacterium]OUV67824.1 MAG: arginyltransferase [Gammaproteobacteria bacterium TMED133]RZO75374.1 MAG: arginyltransferase [OM182 bacterium]
MTSLTKLRFFKTPEHECSYLPQKKAITLFLDPQITINTETYSSLSYYGFRRSGKHIYRPCCLSCNACIPARVQADKFIPKRHHRRIIKKNSDLSVNARAPKMSKEYFDLYERYINTRHVDGDMYPANIDQFTSFLVEGRKEATFFEFRNNDNNLMSVAVTDRLTEGLSAIYTFFDPQARNRSLGAFTLLWLIEKAKRESLRHVYLGYWIKDSHKMDYKITYKPIELYVNGKWTTIT